ncbi:hypothetical protein VNO78_03758 [Psophocarpus tetragonolobus]|uniref:Uncharacterized protein n=1 Tax=Psophocarpus tetragonolobus TaxID=3891 RepID=A0AAN9XVV1_PSOTE
MASCTMVGVLVRAIAFIDNRGGFRHGKARFILMVSNLVVGRELHLARNFSDAFLISSSLTCSRFQFSFLGFSFSNSNFMPSGGYAGLHYQHIKSKLRCKILFVASTKRY